MTRSSIIALVAFVVLVVLVLTMRTSAAQRLQECVLELMRPIQTVTSSTTKQLKAYGNGLKTLDELEHEVDRLHVDNDQLRATNQMMNETASENNKLRAALGFKQRSNFNLLAAHIIARSASSWWSTVQIDRGEADGLDSDMPVVTDQGLVGKTTTVAANTAYVLLITDENCKVSAYVEGPGNLPAEAREKGLVAGERLMDAGAPEMSLNFLPKTAQIAEGQKVFSYGVAGGVFPRGLLLGAIKSVTASRTGHPRDGDPGGGPRAAGERVHRARHARRGTVQPRPGGHPARLPASPDGARGPARLADAEGRRQKVEDEKEQKRRPMKAQGQPLLPVSALPLSVSLSLSFYLLPSTFCLFYEDRGVFRLRAAGGLPGGGLPGAFRAAADVLRRDRVPVPGDSSPTGRWRCRFRGRWRWRFFNGLLWDAITLQFLKPTEEFSLDTPAAPEFAMGWSILLFGVLAVIVHGLRPLFLRGRWELHCLSSGFCASAILLAQYLMITFKRHGLIFPRELWGRILMPGFFAMLLAVPVYFLFRLLAAGLGYTVRVYPTKPRM